MKRVQKPGDLAAMGAPPLFDRPLLVGRPNVGDRERLMGRIAGILDRCWLTNHGEVVREFEARLAAYLDVKHAIAICNGTLALELAIRGLGLRGEIIVPSFTFVATAHALQWQGIAPVFADVDPATHNLDPSAVEAAITPRTTGILGVHLWGRPCDHAALEAVARRRGLRLLYDAAHAFGCSYAGRSVAGLGDAAVLSFHATKVFHTSEGGAVCTNDDDLASRIRLMRNFGFQGFDKVVCLGTNGKMTEIIAAMGLTNLEVIDGFLAVNRRNYDAYAAGLGGIPGVKPIVHDPRERNNYQYVVVEFDGKEFGVSRDALCRLLHAENVIARRYFYPGCHRMEPYRTLMPDAGQGLPHTEALCERVLVFPTGTQTTPAEIAAVCGFVGGVHRLAAEDRLPADLHAAANLGDGGTALKA